MHLTRPKSSKGRSRPSVNSSSTHRPSVSPDYQSRSRNLRSSSQPIMLHSEQLDQDQDQDQVLHMLQHGPAAPPQSLNKYKVLPSIERRQSEVRGLEKHMSKLHLSDDVSNLQQSHKPEGPDPDKYGSFDSDRYLQVWPKPRPDPDPGPVKPKEAGTSGSLLLAIRGPCGRRFQQHFEPTDSLRRVTERAEVKFGVQYGEVLIETMEVPRRSFTDLDVTLAECEIVSRSVLCISYNDSEVETQLASF